MLALRLRRHLPRQHLLSRFLTPHRLMTTGAQEVWSTQRMTIMDTPVPAATNRTVTPSSLANGPFGARSEPAQRRAQRRF
ncbi:hypothetical protein NOCARDAX2BIS_430016 [Nocardioides sp. AX2bis]|nr:hypothetical protein NOCARDAX2BIS_430016 [Nocardioides sp. AX2bis]